MEQTQTPRHFYRCTGCLEVVALAERLQMNHYFSYATCETCAQPFEYMGRVERDRLVTQHTACKCDDRCTSARGPICVCACGGRNHGAGMAGYVTVTTDRGAVPTVKLPNAQRAADALAKYQRAAAAIVTVRAEIKILLDRKHADRADRLNATDYERLLRLQYTLRTATGARTHAARLKAVAAYLPAPTAAPVNDAPIIPTRARVQTSLF